MTKRLINTLSSCFDKGMKKAIAREDCLNVFQNLSVKESLDELKKQLRNHEYQNFFNDNTRIGREINKEIVRWKKLNQDIDKIDYELSDYYSNLLEKNSLVIKNEIEKILEFFSRQGKEFSNLLSSDDEVNNALGKLKNEKESIENTIKQKQKKLEEVTHAVQNPRMCSPSEIFGQPHYCNEHEHNTNIRNRQKLEEEISNIDSNINYISSSINTLHNYRQKIENYHNIHNALSDKKKSFKSDIKSIDSSIEHKIDDLLDFFQRGHEAFTSILVDLDEDGDTDFYGENDFDEIEHEYVN